MKKLILNVAFVSALSALTALLMMFCAERTVTSAIGLMFEHNRNLFSWTMYMVLMEGAALEVAVGIIVLLVIPENIIHQVRRFRAMGSAYFPA